MQGSVASAILLEEVSIQHSALSLGRSCCTTETSRCKCCIVVSARCLCIACNAFTAHFTAHRERQNPFHNAQTAMITWQQGVILWLCDSCHTIHAHSELSFTCNGCCHSTLASPSVQISWHVALAHLHSSMSVFFVYRFWILWLKTISQSKYLKIAVLIDAVLHEAFWLVWGLAMLDHVESYNSRLERNIYRKTTLSCSSKPHPHSTHLQIF